MDQLSVRPRSGCHVRLQLYLDQPTSLYPAIHPASLVGAPRLSPHRVYGGGRGPFPPVDEDSDDSEDEYEKDGEECGELNEASILRLMA